MTQPLTITPATSFAAARRPALTLLTPEDRAAAAARAAADAAARETAARGRDTRTRVLLGQVRARLDAAPVADAPVDLSTLGVSSALVIAPHPDDEVIGCGGLLWHLVHHGARVTVLFLTREGGRSITKPTRVAGVARRDRERRAAERILYYASAEQLPFEERSLEPARRDGRLRAALAPRLAATSPDLVIAPSWHELHPDHRAAAHETIAAARALWQAGALPSLRGVLLYEIWGACAIADAYVPIPRAAAHDMRRALACYESQTDTVDYQALMATLKETRARRLGVHATSDGWELSDARAVADVPAAPWAEAYQALWTADDAARYLAALPDGGVPNAEGAAR